MRFPILILTLAGASLLTGCSSLISLNPFVTDDQLVSDDRLVGTWKHPNAEDKDFFIIEQKDNLYAIRFTGDNSQSVNFDARLVRQGDIELVDLISTDDNAFAVPVHMLARVWMGDGKMQWAFLDSDWLRQQAKQALTTQENGQRTLVTSQGDALVKFLKTNGGDDRARGDANELVRK
jgi:hypothetical protein